MINKWDWDVMAGGIAVSKASSTLLGLANEIQATLEDSAKKGLQLEGGINVIQRKHLERDFESMKLKTKDKRSDFFEAARVLLSEKSYEWFAFFHVHS